MKRDTAQLQWHLQAEARCVRVNGTSTVLAHPAARGSSLWLADVSHVPRLGLKGPAALDWLRAHRLPVPETPNCWVPIDASASWSLVARLGNSEFLIEEEGDAARLDALTAHLQREIPGVYPVLREDSELVLGGALATRALAEVCNVDFAAIHVSARSTLLTMLAGVAVLVIVQADGVPPQEARRYRIWCDPSFGAYLWSTLHDVIAHHSGIVLGLEQLAAPPVLPATERSALGENA